MTALLQGFAAISGFLCNVGAYIQNKADLKELDLYTDELERLNNYFIGLEILQCALLPICLYFIATKNLYGHVTIMWLEDVFLEIPLVWISFHITSHTNESITVFLVLAGGLLGFFVAVGDTVLELREEGNSCAKLFTCLCYPCSQCYDWFKNTTCSECLKACCEALGNCSKSCC